MKSGIRKAVRPGAHRCVEPYARPSRHVLLVDDYGHTREMYAEFLAFVGFDVSAAADGCSAIERAKTRRPELVVMDLALPDMPGWEAASILRRDPRMRDVPIIALTAYPESDAREVALRSGCDLFLEKPVGPNALADRIDELLKKKQKPAGRA